jgi:hypothetical protein
LLFKHLFMCKRLWGSGAAVGAGYLMKRYFFHVLSGGGEYRDEEGETCASADDAEGHALFMAKEIYRLLDDESRRDERVAAISVPGD